MTCTIAPSRTRYTRESPMLSVTQCGASPVVSRNTPVSVVPVPSSVVSGCDAMSFTARASAFSIAFGRHRRRCRRRRAGARSCSRSRSRRRCARPCRRRRRRAGYSANTASWLTSRRRPVWVTAAQVSSMRAAGHRRPSGTGWMLRARPVPPVIRRTSRGRTAGRRPHILVGSSAAASESDAPRVAPPARRRRRAGARERGIRQLRRRSAPRTARCRAASTRPCAASSSSCEPCSTIAPFSITRMRSASRIVESRCAMTKAVRSSRSRDIARWMSSSVRVSTDRGRLVEDEQARIGEERARDGDELPLADAEVGRLVVEHRVVAVGQRVHEAVDVRRRRRGDDLLLRGVRAAVGDVLADRAGEQPRVLQHHAGARAQVVAGHAHRVDAVEGDPPALDVVEPHDEVHERRLAGAGRSDDRDGAARASPSRLRPVDERLVGAVAERDILEREVARRLGRRLGVDRRRAPPRPRRAARTRARALATPDCSRFAIEPSWLSGCVNWREYWMNACTSPIDMQPRRHLQSADDGDRDVDEVPDEHHRGHDRCPRGTGRRSSPGRPLRSRPGSRPRPPSGGRTPSRSSDPRRSPRRGRSGCRWPSTARRRASASAARRAP